MGYSIGLNPYGSLSNNTFQYGGTTNTVSSLQSISSIFTLQLGSNSDLTAITNWTLHVGSEKFASADGVASGSVGYFWNPPLIPSWCPGDTVTVKLTQTTAPAAPRNLHAKGTSTTQIDLFWSAPERTGGSDITGYKIEVSTDRGIMWTDLVASQTATTYSHTVTSGALRYYRVSAINAIGTGPESRTASASAMDSAPGVVSAEIGNPGDTVVRCSSTKRRFRTRRPPRRRSRSSSGGRRVRRFRRRS